MLQILNRARPASEDMTSGEGQSIIDLCSGLGGASEAHVVRGDHVLRIENNPALDWVEATTICEVGSRRCRDAVRRHGHTDLVWASPTCTQFSNAYSAPTPVARRAGKTPFPDLGLLEACVRQIEDIDPRYWILENVHGAIPFFKPYLGAPAQIIGPFALWGRFPHIAVDLGTHSKYTGDPHSSDPLRANKRAKIPYPLSVAVRDAVAQPNLEAF